jgi:putative membrane protein
MMSSALISFGHFMAFFAMTAALVVQMVLLSEMISIERARRIHRASIIYILSAILILIFGLLRVYYFEKGADYYFGNHFFIIKLLVFLLIAGLHTIPAWRFFFWNKAISHGKAPELSERQVRTLRLIIHAELTGIGVIVLCAALMAHGIGGG